MMDDIFTKKKERVPFELNLNSLADIVSILVIYLIVTTVFGASDISLPKDFRLPTSLSKEQMEVAPQILVHNGMVTFSKTKKSISVASLIGGGSSAEDYLGHLRAAIKDHKKVMGDAQLLLSFVADSRTEYGHVYPIIRALRQAGFETVIFVAAGEEG
jgi:biopolymer transport protein ExbD